MGAVKLGEMDRQIVIEKKTITRTPLGDQTETWVPIAPPVWARVIPASGREYFNAVVEQRVSSKATRFRIRFRADVRNDTQLHIVYDGQTYDVQYVAEIGRRVGLEVVAEAIAQS